jgi:hypothetical protein
MQELAVEARRRTHSTACAASATIAGLRHRARSMPGIMLSASVAMIVRRPQRVYRNALRPELPASPTVTKLMPIFASV